MSKQYPNGGSGKLVRAVFCRACQRWEVVDANNFMEARKLARDRGWFFKRGEGWFCKYCGFIHFGVKPSTFTSVKYQIKQLSELITVSINEVYSPVNLDRNTKEQDQAIVAYTISVLVPYGGTGTFPHAEMVNALLTKEGWQNLKSDSRSVNGFLYTLITGDRDV